MLPASTDSLAPGVSFGSYVVRELIGRGGMASVYRAEHLLLAKPVALKVMERSLLSTAGSRQRFVLEGRAAAAIKHPNIVDITDVGVHEDVPFLVMELLTGEDLDVHLKRHGPLDEASTVRLALPIITALHAAHGRGVIHRDIKPSNIFLSQGPDDQIVPKVLDFGISKVITEGANMELSLTPHHQVMGTPRYLPPEALQSPRDLGPASDQFSLGVVLYECVTGSTPYSGDSLIALLNALSVGAFVPPRELAPDISPGLDRVIMRALALQPSDRFATIRDMGRALLELAAERTQMVWGHSFKLPGTEVAPSSRGRSAVVTQPLEPPSFFARNRRVAFGAGFIGIGALASALATGFLNSSAGPRDGAPQPPKQEPTVSVAAALPAPAEPPVRPVVAPADGAASEKNAREPDDVGSPSERARSARGPGRRPKAGPARRAKAGAPTPDAPGARRDEPAAVSPVADTASTVSPAAPATPPPSSAAVRGPSPTRRQGANNSPLLD